MKSKFIYSLVCAAMLTAGISSCEDRLDIQEHGVLDYNTFYQNDDEAVEAVTAIYIQINSSSTIST